MNAQPLPEALVITVETGGRPLTKAWVLVRLGTVRRNPHEMLAGPTDDHGRVVVSRLQIEENARRTIEMTPMDYVGLDAWDGSIHVEALNRERVRDAVSAVGVWEDLGSLGSEENLGLLRSYGESLEPLAGAELAVEVSCEPGGAADIETVVVRA
jgi:hypothetical protein